MRFGVSATRPGFPEGRDAEGRVVATADAPGRGFPRPDARRLEFAARVAVDVRYHEHRVAVPIYKLTEEISFPHPSLATRGGLLAVGGDLRPERILFAYRHGIFPWYSEGRPILWWCPAPRLLLIPSEVVVNRTLRKVIRRGTYTITADTAFEAIIDGCAAMPRSDQDGTWITEDMRAAYLELHRQGYAHSIEAWDAQGGLAGGLYGLSIGGAFFGESMFALQPDASKVAFATLVGRLDAWAFDFIDCQVVTEHLVRFGAREVQLDDFLARVEASTARPTRKGPWTAGFAEAKR